MIATRQQHLRGRFRRGTGLTVIEVLVAITLLSVIIMVVLANTGNLYKLLNRSQQSLQMNSAAQSVIELLRSQWRSYPLRDNPNADPNIITDNQAILAKNVLSQQLYDRNCFALDLLGNVDLPSYVSQGYVSLYILDRNGVSQGTLTINQATDSLACVDFAADAGVIPLKRIVVDLPSADGESSSLLKLDILRPSTTCAVNQC
ncbi:MAG: type II secretion system protein [Deinococcales bacterium]